MYKGKLKTSLTPLKTYSSGYILSIKIPVERLIEVRRRCGMEKSVEKSKAMKISRQPSPVQIVRTTG
jgi:hypothetical protein